MIPRLHVLVGDDELNRPDGPVTARGLLERLGPGVAVHLRARVTARRLAELAHELAPVAAAAGGWCVVNGRLDVALAAGAQAVQLGQGAIDVGDARALIVRLGRAMRVGVSVHGVAESLDAAAGGWCVVNGRLDVALAARAQAVQLGQGAIDVGDARALIVRLGRAMRVGVSVHGVAESLDAAERGAQHLVLGTIFPTPTHPERSGSGSALIREARERLDGAGRSEVALLAIGGLGPERVAEVREAGAHGIVVRRAVWSAADPLEAARALVERLGPGQ